MHMVKLMRFLKISVLSKIRKLFVKQESIIEASSNLVRRDSFVQNGVMIQHS